MPLRVRIAARAARQIQQAAEWWAVNRPLAPNALATDLNQAVMLLAEQPGIGAPYAGGRLTGVRRLYLSRVGYFVYYRVNDECLDVLAFWHARREHPPSL